MDLESLASNTATVGEPRDIGRYYRIWCNLKKEDSTLFEYFKWFMADSHLSMGLAMREMIRKQMVRDREEGRYKG